MSIPSEVNPYVFFASILSRDGVNLNGRICSSLVWEKILSFRSRLLFQRVTSSEEAKKNSNNLILKFLEKDQGAFIRQESLQLKLAWTGACPSPRRYYNGTLLWRSLLGVACTTQNFMQTCQYSVNIFMPRSFKDKINIHELDLMATQWGWRSFFCRNSGQYLTSRSVQILIHSNWYETVCHKKIMKVTEWGGGWWYSLKLWTSARSSAIALLVHSYRRFKKWDFRTRKWDILFTCNKAVFDSLEVPQEFNNWSQHVFCNIIRNCAKLINPIPLICSSCINMLMQLKAIQLL